MRQIDIDVSVEMQLESIFAYTVHRWGYAQATVYSDALFEAMRAIAADRVSWRRIPASFQVDGYVRKCGSHLIYWRCGSDEIVRIVAVLHERMHQSLRLREALEGAA